MKDLIREVAQKFPDTVIRENEPLARYTSFKIGGPAELFLQVQTSDAVPQLLTLIRRYEVPIHILGGGSNLLISDAGVRGVVLKVGCGNVARIDETCLRTDAGCQKAAAAAFAQRAGLTGLEFLHGIPGTLGGGVYMNAGAYGGELSQVVERVTACTQNGDIVVLGADDLAFSYRHSVLKDRRELTALSVDLRLTPDDPTAIRTRMEDLMARRRERQPLEYPSAGSTFKRPEGYFAGKLIEDCGLKGYAVGGACVSEKHAGFVINRGGATCEDVRRLIAQIQEKVLRTFGVALTCEIEMW